MLGRLASTTAPGSVSTSRQIRFVRPLHVLRFDWRNQDTIESSTRAYYFEVARSITAADVVRDLARLVRERGAPEFFRSDNGPEFVAKALRNWIEAKGFKTCFIEPGSPRLTIPSNHQRLRLELDYFRRLSSIHTLIFLRTPRGRSHS